MQAVYASAANDKGNQRPVSPLALVLDFDTTVELTDLIENLYREKIPAKQEVILRKIKAQEKALPGSLRTLKIEGLNLTEYCLLYPLEKLSRYLKEIKLPQTIEKIERVASLIIKNIKRDLEDGYVDKGVELIEEMDVQHKLKYEGLIFKYLFLINKYLKLSEEKGFEVSNFANQEGFTLQKDQYRIKENIGFARVWISIDLKKEGEPFAHSSLGMGIEFCDEEIEKAAKPLVGNYPVFNMNKV